MNKMLKFLGVIAILNLVLPLFYTAEQCLAQYNKLHDFPLSSINGDSPTGSLISDGVFLYGVTQSGGANNLGVIFKIKPDGTEYSKLIDFSAQNGGTPIGSLISDGAFFYGTTSAGGTNNLGVIFKVRINSLITMVFRMTQNRKSVRMH